MKPKTVFLGDKWSPERIAAALGTIGTSIQRAKYVDARSKGDAYELLNILAHQISAPESVPTAVDDVTDLVSNIVSVCSGDLSVSPLYHLSNGELSSCMKLATKSVAWSDRDKHVCDEHVAYAVACAANDNTHDRTDKPYISPLHQSEIVHRWWPTIAKMAKEIWL